MNMIHQTTFPTAPTERHTASPYARRLAREQDLPLASIAGTGPGGRVVAVDVLNFELPAPAPMTTVPLSAFSATVDLGALSAILTQFADAGHDITAADALVRATTKALAADPRDDAPGTAIIAVETPQGDIILTGSDKMSVSAQRAQQLAADPVSPGDAVAELSLWVQPHHGIRSAILPLRPNRDLRLIATISADQTQADLLIVFSTTQTTETRAAGLLADIQNNLHESLMLFA
mgnify:CR=1 FL=1